MYLNPKCNHVSEYSSSKIELLWNWNFLGFSLELHVHSLELFFFTCIISYQYFWIWNYKNPQCQNIHFFHCCAFCLGMWQASVLFSLFASTVSHSSLKSHQYHIPTSSLYQIKSSRGFSAQPWSAIEGSLVCLIMLHTHCISPHLTSYPSQFSQS